MNSSGKPIEIRQEAFSQAREKLGLSIQDLALKACLSNRQIQQIENGEHSAFYSHAIKLTAAKKVALLLELSEQEAFDLGEQTSVPEVEAAQTDAIVEMPEVILPKKAKSSKSIQQTIAITEVSIPSASKKESAMDRGDPRSFSPKIRRSNASLRWKVVGWLILLVFLIFAIINLQKTFFSTSGTSVVGLAPMSNEQLPAPPPADNLALVAVESAPNSIAGEAGKSLVSEAAITSPAKAPPIAVELRANTSSTCPNGDGAVETYQTSFPRKAGNMVYIKTNIKEIICVVDASGKNQIHEFVDGLGYSFYGTPPFKVFTNGLQELDIYFQGMRVRPTNTQAKVLILEEVPIPAGTSNTETSAVR